MAPTWLTVLADVYLLGGLVCAGLIVADLARGHPQKTKVMNWVWPVQALYFGPAGWWLYARFGRPLSKGVNADPKQHRPFWEKVLVGVTHCGAGCTLGDIVGEWVVYLGAFTIAGAAIWPELLLDFVLAFGLGIVFQYFAIAPMRGEHGWKGIRAAMKADALSLLSFEVGLFGWMLLMRFVFFSAHPLHPTQTAYWFLMAVGMLVGFATAFPANWWLLRKGFKEAM